MASVDTVVIAPSVWRQRRAALVAVAVGLAVLAIAWILVVRRTGDGVVPAMDSYASASQVATPLPAVTGEAITPLPAALPPTTAYASGAPTNVALADAEALMADAGPSITGSPTGAVIVDRATQKIRQASQFAQRGAFFAARRELLAVLQMIAEAKDQKHGAPRRVPALAAGLKALDEADDFATSSATANARTQLAVILASHQTPVGRSPAAAGLMPTQLADLYYRYAQLQLGAAVANEPAGSMALHSLGKLYSQFGRIEPQTFPQPDRRAFTLAQAAVLARPDNYLASHELGVLLAESGHLAEAEVVLVRVAQQEPHPTAFRNLARVQRKLGRGDYAVANERHADMLAARVPASGGNVEWTSREQFVAAGDAMRAGPAGQPAAPVQQAARPGGAMK